MVVGIAFRYTSQKFVMLQQILIDLEGICSEYTKSHVVNEIFIHLKAFRGWKKMKITSFPFIPRSMNHRSKPKGRS